MIEVACAIIQHQGKILICQRSKSMSLPGKWEFPGGKREEFESLSDCLIREIHEELSLEIEIQFPLNPVHHGYPDFSLSLHPFVCAPTHLRIEPKEHSQAIWVPLSQLDVYDWAPADIPILTQIKAYASWNIRVPDYRVDPN